MRRLVTWIAALALLGVSAAALADLVVETDEERIDRLIDDVADARHKGDTLLRAVDLRTTPLEVSVGEDVERYRAGDDAVVVGRAAELDERLGEGPLEVRQREVRIDGTHARVIVNLDRAGELIACDVSLERAGDRWVLSRIRVMG